MGQARRVDGEVSSALWVALSGNAVVLAAAGLGCRSVLVRIRVVHQLVNNQLDRQLQRTEQLMRTLTAAGMVVPHRIEGDDGEQEAREHVMPG